MPNTLTEEQKNNVGIGEFSEDFKNRVWDIKDNLLDLGKNKWRRITGGKGLGGVYVDYLRADIVKALLQTARKEAIEELKDMLVLMRMEKLFMRGELPMNEVPTLKNLMVKRTTLYEKYAELQGVDSSVKEESNEN